MPKPTKTRRARKTESVDLYQKVTDRIVEALENGVAPWKKPWRTAGRCAAAGPLPANALTGKAVRSVYGLIQNYRTVPVTYDDIRNKTERGLAAISRLGEPDPAIMSGKKRSSFSSLNAITSEED